MADKPSKADITAIFKRLRSIPTNKQCFDCGHSNPTWASVTYGVFLCIDCSAVHRSLGVHVTFIRSTQLDTNWTWLQVRAMQIGGNAAATAFFRQHGCDTTDAQKKYHSRAAGLYRERLLSKAQAAMRLHGTKLFLESGHPHDKVHIDIGHPDATSPEAKEVDFFKEHTELDAGDASPIPALSSESKLYQASEPQPIKNGSLGSTAAPEDPSAGPNVEAALSMSPTQAQAISEPRKTLIGTKKPGTAKKGKGGLGAQRVKADFKEIENQAVRLDQEREELAKATAIQEAKTKEEQEKQMASMRLAYQDMSLQRQKQEEKLKAADPKKAEQFERLGMGFAGNRGISHSAMSDMQTIQQETPSGDRSDRDRDRFRDRYDRGSSRKDFFEDEFEMLGGFSSSKSSSRGYSDSLYGAKKDDFGAKKDDFGSKNDDFGMWGNPNKEGTWGNPNKEGTWDMDRFDSKPSSSLIDSSSSRSGTERAKRDPSGRSRKTETSAEPTSDIAQKRFGNAKSISSEQFFAGTESSFEAQQNLGRLAGRSGFGSDDYFGRGDTRSTRSSNAPDLQDIKDGVKQGVTKVAGKLSNLANGVITSLQDRYT